MSLRPLRLAWRCLGLLGLVGVAAVVRGQGNPDSGLRTNEVAVQITFTMGSKTQAGGVDSVSEGVQEVFAADSLMKVTGRFAAQIHTPSVGKRSIFLTRRLPGELVGSFNENRRNEIIGEWSEGGFQPDAHTVRREEWKNSGVDLSPSQFELNLDLDEATWDSREFFDAVDDWMGDVIRGHQYLGSYYGPNTWDGKWSWQILPPSPPEGLNTARTLLGLDWFKFHIYEQLKRDATGYSGKASRTHPLGKEYEATLSLSWEVLAAPPEVELRVTSPKLREWRPTGDRDPKGSNARLRGKPLDLTAEVVSPSGANLSTLRIRKMRWWLEDTSRLPGVAMNWPYASNDTSPDLQIGHARATDEHQNLELTEVTTLRKTVQIVPYDFGGWTTLRVEVELDDGRKLQGKLKGQSGDETAIRLPAREENSKISTHWKRKAGAADLPDDSDEDFIPGDSDGDGFTLFEEYRGFYAVELEKGPDAVPDYFSPDPLRQTIFIYDRIHDDHTRNGISHFRKASQAQAAVIKPEHGLLDESRVMNRNPGDAPSKGPQHAIGIRRSSGWGPKSPGSPGAAEVAVPTLNEIERLFPTLAREDLYDRAIAQHMLTACRVGLPGSGDKMMTLTVSRGLGGGPVVEAAGGGSVTLRAEATGHDLGEDWLKQVELAAAVARARARVAYRGTPLEQAMERDAEKNAREVFGTTNLYVAVRGGEHSGPLGNIMRQAFAQGYRINNTDTIVVLPKPSGEKIGYQLSTTSEGDGYNAPKAPTEWPPTRYGSSSSPPSRSQFNVSDRSP